MHFNRHIIEYNGAAYPKFSIRFGIFRPPHLVKRGLCSKRCPVEQISRRVHEWSLIFAYTQLDQVRFPFSDLTTASQQHTITRTLTSPVKCTWSQHDSASVCIDRVSSRILPDSAGNYPCCGKNMTSRNKNAKNAKDEHIRTHYLPFKFQIA